MTQLSSQIKEKIRSFSERYASLLSEETLPDPLLPQKQHMRKQEIEAEEKKDLTAFVERIQMSLDEIAGQFHEKDLIPITFSKYSLSQPAI